MKQFGSLLLAFGLSLCAFAAGETNSAAAANPSTSSNSALALSKERIVFRTNLGDIVVALYPEIAPKHTAQILKMTAMGIYDGTGIFRIEPGFVAQIDNFDRRKPPLSTEQWNSVYRLPLEPSTIEHRRGLLSMARLDDLNSAESSFSFMLGKAPHLDGKYTIFGEIVQGMDVLDRIEEQKTNDGHAPLQILEISKAEVIADGNLTGVQLAPAHPYEAPNETSRKWFLLFAFGAFAVTILWPIAKTSLEKPKPVQKS